LKFLLCYTPNSQKFLANNFFSKAHTALTAPLVLHHTRIYKRAMKKIIYGQMRNKPFLIVIYHSSLVKAAMDAARVRKMRNGVSKTIEIDTLV
jgi:hypothetical protein